MKHLLQEYTTGLDRPLADQLRVLIVEDSALQRRILAAALNKWGYLVDEAATGLEALEICSVTPPDLVISDWMMPGMDGLEFCRHFRAMDRDWYGYFILLTSKSDKGEVAQGLDCGADDFLSKPVNQTELRARISAGERIIGMERQLQSQNKLIGETLAEITELHEATYRDLRQARQIQESLLPQSETNIGSSKVSCSLNSCGHVGGDLVGLFRCGDDQIGMFNMDVSGHGITSALMTARISGYFSERFLDQNVALNTNSDGDITIREPAEVAEILNERLLVDHGIDQYFTMAFAAINLRTGRAKITQAGHPDPIIIRANGEIEYQGQGGFPIGLLEGAEFEQFELTLNAGDRLLFCSDGYTEATLEGGHQLEKQGLNKLIEQNSQKSGFDFLNRVYVGLKNILPDEGQLEDDISSIMLEFNSG